MTLSSLGMHAGKLGTNVLCCRLLEKTGSVVLLDVCDDSAANCLARLTALDS